MTEQRLSSDWLDERVRGASPAPTLAINELSQALHREGRDVYRLGLGQSPFPVPASVVEALRQHAEERDYLPVRGLPALRRAVAGHVRNHTGLAYDPEHVLIGPGSKQLLFLTQMVIDAELILPSPSWVSYAPQARLAGRTVQWLPTRRADRWHLDPDVLDAHCTQRGPRRRLLLLNYPNNPNGATMPRALLSAIAAVARRHSLLVMSDEIYGLVDHHGKHESIATFYPEGTLVTSGLSKWCGAGGWRLGTLLIPKELGWLADALSAVASETHTAVSAPIQYAAITAFSGNEEIDDYLRHSRRVLRALGRHSARALTDTGLDVDFPDGGFYLFPDASPFTSSLASRAIGDGPTLCARMLEESDVATLPGAVFGRPPEELTFRLSYVDFDGGVALEASRRVPNDSELDETFLRQHCGRVVTAIERIASWISARTGLHARPARLRDSPARR
jgi:aspartate aminotransferase